MRVFRIVPDSNLFQSFLPSDAANVMVFDMDGSSKIQTWVPPAVYVLMPKLKKGDFYQFNPSTLITSERATEALRSHLEAAGELLPLVHEGEQFTVLNVTQCINCLDTAKTDWYLVPDTGQKIRPKRYVFHSGRFIESTLFKIPETARAEIFVLEGLHPPEEEFRAIVERQKLQGIKFVEVWNDEEDANTM
jgi:hypothetical protein